MLRYYVDENNVYQGGVEDGTGIDVSLWTEVPVRECSYQEWDGAVWKFTKAGLCARLAEYRYNREIGGILVQGLPVPTDDRAKTLISGKYSKVIEENDPLKIFKIKVSGVFFEITNAQLIEIFQSVNSHVQKCFDCESVVYADIQNGILTTVEEVYAAFDQVFAAT